MIYFMRKRLINYTLSISNWGGGVLYPYLPFCQAPFAMEKRDFMQFLLKSCIG